MADDFITMESGNVKISEEVISTIAALASQEVEGVAMIGTQGGGLSELLGKKNSKKGIKIEFLENSTIVEVHITVKFGNKIQEIAKAVQIQVRNAIETMAGLENVTVNVHVDGVAIVKEKDEADNAQIQEAEKTEE